MFYYVSVNKDTGIVQLKIAFVRTLDRVKIHSLLLLGFDFKKIPTGIRTPISILILDLFILFERNDCSKHVIINSA